MGKREQEPKSPGKLGQDIFAVNFVLSKSQFTCTADCAT